MFRFFEWLCAFVRWYPVTLYRWVEGPGEKDMVLVPRKFWKSWVGWRYVYWCDQGEWNNLLWRE